MTQINSLDGLIQYLPFLLPLMIIQLALMIIAVVHIVKHDTFKVGNKLIWLIVVVFVNIIGPILYFTIGKGDE